MPWRAGRHAAMSCNAREAFNRTRISYLPFADGPRFPLEVEQAVDGELRRSDRVFHRERHGHFRLVDVVKFYASGA